MVEIVLLIFRSYQIKSMEIIYLYYQNLILDDFYAAKTGIGICWSS